ncbi:hypothetical protein [Bifidobacterium adolescentis]|jgi:hypothetical protein|uniref:hypothetical protein n=1 Tax=Bifidobacterium adolescentis TaxID=1680 RepID=UPI00216B3F83|nr:hypothetical protein [Bifidobacterium adolescentis]
MTYEGVHMNPDYIKGVDLGNWLVLEKWMNPALFDGTTADDEYYLPTQLDPAVYEARIKTHRAEYINERDSATIKSWGLNPCASPCRTSSSATVHRSSAASTNSTKPSTRPKNTA